jgi:ClpP class serine protease
MMVAHKFERQGLLAFDPRAVFDVFFAPPARDNVTQGDVEIVSVAGPLEHHAGMWCDSYDAVTARVSAALDGPARTVVMKIDSPGGLVSGAFETARTLRSKAQATGKSLVAYVDGSCCSAAYALASAADRIVASETSVVGSIGIIDTRVDATALDAAQGIRYAFVTSGTRKADGNPHAPLSAAELVEKQSLVDDVAAVFFALVRDLRGIDAAPLEARVFVGAAAKTAGLVDEITSFGNLLASFAGPALGVAMSTYSEARAALEEIAKGDDDEAKRAQRALAAMDDDDEEPEAAADEEPEAAAESDPDPDPDDEKKPDPEASASAPGSSTASASSSSLTLRAMAAELQRAHVERGNTDASERSKLLASYPNLAPGLKRLLASAPIAEVKEVIASLPKPARAPAANGASATPRATRGDTQGTRSGSDPATVKAMDERMGFTRTVMGVRREGNAQVFGAMTAPSAGTGGAK